MPEHQSCGKPDSDTKYACLQPLRQKQTIYATGETNDLSETRCVFVPGVLIKALLNLPQLFSLYLPFVLISLYSLNKSPQCHSALQI